MKLNYIFCKILNDFHRVFVTNVPFVTFVHLKAIENTKHLHTVLSCPNQNASNALASCAFGSVVCVQCLAEPTSHK